MAIQGVREELNTCLPGAQIYKLTDFLCHLYFYCYFSFWEGPNLRAHPDTLKLSDNNIKGSHFGHVSFTIQHNFTYTR